MNILFLTAYPPIPHRHGGGMRMYHNIRILASRHAVHLISFVESDSERDELGLVRDICDTVHAVDRQADLRRPRSWSLDPAVMSYFDVPAMRRAVEEAFARQQIDVLQCEYLYMTRYHRAGVFTVWTAHETLSPNARQDFLAEPGPLEKARKYYRWKSMLRYEIGAVRKFDRTIAMTDEDAAYLRSCAPEAEIRAMPIGVDSSWYAPGDETPADPIRAVFLGNFRHRPNFDAVVFLKEHVMPFFPAVRFEIAGEAPDGLLAGTPAVGLGHLFDTRPLYRRPNTIVVAPLFSGTGQRVKLLEAFSMGMPVVTTTTGARGFPIADGVQARIADTPAAFRDALDALCGSVELRRRLGDAGRRMILDGFDWTRLEARYLDAVMPRSRRHRT